MKQQIEGWLVRHLGSSPQQRQHARCPGSRSFLDYHYSCRYHAYRSCRLRLSFAKMSLDIWLVEEVPAEAGLDCSTLTVQAVWAQDFLVPSYHQALVSLASCRASNRDSARFVVGASFLQSGTSEICLHSPQSARRPPGLVTADQQCLPSLGCRHCGGRAYDCHCARR